MTKSERKDNLINLFFSIQLQSWIAEVTNLYCIIATKKCQVTNLALLVIGQLYLLFRVAFKINLEQQM